MTVLGQVLKSLLGDEPCSVSYCERDGSVCDGVCREKDLRARTDRMRGKLFSSF